MLCLAVCLLTAACTGGPHSRVPGDTTDPVAALGPDAVVSFALIDGETGAEIAAQVPNRPMIPASTAKTATMIAALELLGPDYRFATRVFATGTPDGDGVLTGDLILKGGGDPLLGPQDLLGLAQRLHDLGLRRVTGRFLFDTSLLPKQPSIEPDQPAEARYNPGVGALAIDFNQWRLLWRNGEGTSHIQRLPPLGQFQIRPTTGTEGAGRNVTWDGRTADDDAWRLVGNAPGTGDRFLPIKAPGHATAALFRRLAAQVGTVLPPPDAGTAPQGAVPVAQVLGLPLSEVVRLGLQHSNNLVAELIGLTATRLYKGRPENLEASTTALSGWLHQAVTARLGGVDWTGWRLHNHSGLSRESRVTATQMAAILRFAQGRRYGGWPFASFLPAAGFRRSFRDRFLTEAAVGRLWAKTGTMHYAKGLVGYLMDGAGRTRVFALYIADPAARAAYDALRDADRDAPEEQERARAWADAAERAEEAIVLDWMARF